uniref:Uncharacterized protein n=1 Tax=Anopheles farauti TaxID=69004 RepID=A0A182QH95_9DIPT
METHAAKEITFRKIRQQPEGTLDSLRDGRWSRQVVTLRLESVLVRNILQRHPVTVRIGVRELPLGNLGPRDAGTTYLSLFVADVFQCALLFRHDAVGRFVSVLVRTVRVYLRILPQHGRILIGRHGRNQREHHHTENLETHRAKKAVEHVPSRGFITGWESGEIFERTLDGRRDGWWRGQVVTERLETVLVRDVLHPYELPVRCRLMKESTPDDTPLRPDKLKMIFPSLPRLRLAGFGVVMDGEPYRVAFRCRQSCGWEDAPARTANPFRSATVAQNDLMKL